MRTSVWIAAATLIHAGILAALLLIPRSPLRFATATDAPPTEIAIALESEPTVARERLEPPAGAMRETGSVAAPSAEVAARGAATGISSAAIGAQSPATGGAGEGAPGEPAAPAGSGGGVAVPIPLSASELGLGGSGTNPFLPRTATSAEPPARPAAEEGLRAALRESDRVRGMGPEGPVMKALSAATSRSFAPFSGRAVFDVHAGSDGEVLRVELVAGGGDAGWMDARRLAVEELRGKKLKVPSGATAMIMRIEVVSEWKLPDGASAPTSFGGRRGAAGMPELTIPDPSNIGAKPRRVVRTHSVSTQVL